MKAVSTVAWRRKTWIVALIATALAFVSTASVAATIAPLPTAPAPTSSEGPAPRTPAGLGSTAQETALPVQTQADSHAGAVTISARIEPARLLVLDSEGRVVEIWSNTGTSDSDPLLSARLHAVDGPVLPEIPKRALSEYHRLLGQVDWSVRGLTYAAD